MVLGKGKGIQIWVFHDEMRAFALVGFLHSDCLARDGVMAS